MKKSVAVVLVVCLLFSLCGCSRASIIRLLDSTDTSPEASAKATPVIAPEMTPGASDVADADAAPSGTPDDTPLPTLDPTPEPSGKPAAQYLQIAYDPYLISQRDIEIYGKDADMYCDFYRQYVEDVIDQRPDRSLPDGIRALPGGNLAKNLFQRNHPLEGLVMDSTINIEETHTLIAYHFGVEEHEEKVALIAQKVEDIIASTICEDFSQLEATLALYRYLSETSTYAWSGEDSTYGVLMNSQGVCVGFTSVLRLLLLQVGYDDGYTIIYTPDNKDEIGHVWNMININGNWYHFDITWENTAASAPEKQLYYFGMTDAERADPYIKHYEIECAPKMPVPECTDDAFSPLRSADECVYDLENHRVYLLTYGKGWRLWNTQDMTFTEVDGPEI